MTQDKMREALEHVRSEKKRTIDMHKAFEDWVKTSEASTDLSRYQGGYASPLVDLGWRAWCAASDLVATPSPPVVNAEGAQPNPAGKIATALGMFASCIKSRENWSSTYEQVKAEAYDALHSLASQVERLTAERDRERRAYMETQLGNDDLANRCLDLRGRLNRAVEIGEEEIRRIVVTIPTDKFKAASSDYVLGFAVGIKGHEDAVLALINSKHSKSDKHRLDQESGGAAGT